MVSAGSYKLTQTHLNDDDSDNAPVFFTAMPACCQQLASCFLCQPICTVLLCQCRSVHSELQLQMALSVWPCLLLQARVKFHVLLTTYEMVGFEAGTLRSLEWETLLVDEGHRYTAVVASKAMSD